MRNGHIPVGIPEFPGVGCLYQVAMTDASSKLQYACFKICGGKQMNCHMGRQRLDLSSHFTNAVFNCVMHYPVYRFPQEHDFAA